VKLQQSTINNNQRERERESDGNYSDAKRLSRERQWCARRLTLQINLHAEQHNNNNNNQQQQQQQSLKQR
jgi:hypothetical protein